MLCWVFGLDSCGSAGLEGRVDPREVTPPALAPRATLPYQRCLVHRRCSPATSRNPDFSHGDLLGRCRCSAPAGGRERINYFLNKNTSIPYLYLNNILRICNRSIESTLRITTSLPFSSAWRAHLHSRSPPAFPFPASANDQNAPCRPAPRPPTPPPTLPA